ncbi:hypothetical protein SEA_DIANE_77 [Streptomyces phage Diane]|uniref:Uncharacterized protein n=1 Tax=Streptomyces phage Diane TaxID=2041207 RepID=A0A291LHP5_9CAUD|nr:hypothetical protein KGG78_gp77 [Streptomyces phage Diane]ATI18861.1 hypothetical protein SEA_DIANE_77 [Streptomyces phage Diane]
MVAGAALAAALLTGCGDDRPCAESHTELKTVVSFNGKTTTTSIVPVSVCDRYEDER